MRFRKISYYLLKFATPQGGEEALKAYTETTKDKEFKKKDKGMK